MEEIKVPAAEFQRNLDHFEDVASHRPVAVTRDGRESHVLLSIEEYRRLKRRDRDVLDIEDFTEADAAAVRRAEPSAASIQFNSEIARDP